MSRQLGLSRQHSLSRKLVVSRWIGVNRELGGEQGARDKQATSIDDVLLYLGGLQLASALNNHLELFDDGQVRGSF